jgi:hypothetical protein
MDPEQRAIMKDRFARQGEFAVEAQAESEKARAAIPRNPVADEFVSTVSEEGLWTKEALDMFLKDPAGIIGQFSVESAPNALATVLGSMFGGPAMGGVAGYGIERGASMKSALNDIGVDTSDPEQVLTALQNPETRGQLEEYATKRGLPIAAFDALTLGLGTALAKKPVSNIVSQLVAEPVAEGAGEATAQMVADGEVDMGEVVAEAIGGVGSGAVQAGMTSAEAMLQNNPEVQTDGPTQPPAPEAPTQGGNPQSGPDAPVNRVAPTQPPAQPEPEAPEVKTEETDAQEPQAAPPQEPLENSERQTVYTPEGDPVEVETIVVEAEDLLTSDREGYPAEMQPRDRDRAASQEQISKIASNPVPQRLDASPETDRGAPIVDAQNLVESGNGRVMGLRQAYTQGSSDTYRQYVESRFPQAKGMAAPVIVRRRVSNVDEQQFARASNVPATLQMSAGENARADSSLIDQDVLALYRGGGLANAGNRDMVRAFFAKLPQSVRGAMTTEQGGLSAEGQKRFLNALFHRAYGDDRMLNRISESTDDDMKSVTNALAESAGRVAQLKAAIERKEVSPDTDVTSDMMDAIERIASFRAKGMNLSEYRAQQDAFSDPASEASEIFMSAFYNDAETRLVSKKAMQDFIEAYVAEAMEQKVDQDDLPGVEAVTPKTGTEIIDGQQEEKRAKAQTGTLLDAAAANRQSPAKKRAEKQRDVDGEDGTEPNDLDNPDEEGTRPQPKGSLAPTFTDFSFTNRNSVYEAAFREAGMEPDAARLLDSDRQINLLTKVLRDKYGVTVEFPTRLVNRKTVTGRQTQDKRRKISSRDAIDQLLDAYRQMEMLAHILGVPHEALGLKDQDGKPVVLSLDSQLPGALGMFSMDEAGKRTISLPGRSNSFAHEWGHALDQWLSRFLTEADDPSFMLSRDVMADGIDPKATRSEAISQAFVGVMQALFGDKAKLAALTFDLQQQTQIKTKSGKESAKAKRAKAMLKDLESGKKPPKSVWSRYFQTSLEFDKMLRSRYFQDPAEMLARAMETYAGVRASQISDLPTSFLSKPSWAYTGSEDTRASMTFPRGADAENIFAAFDRLGDALRDEAVFGSKGRANKPEDVDVFDMRKWDKWKPKGTLLEQERQAWAKAEASSKEIKRGASATQKTLDVVHNVASTFQGYLRVMVNRQPKEAQAVLTKLLDDYITDPGSGRKIKQVWEAAVEAKSKHMTNRLDAIIGEYKLNNLSRDQQRELRRLMTVTDAKTQDPRMSKAAADLRRLMDDMWRYVDSAGVKVGYARNGYLPRLIDTDMVMAEKKKFTDQAAKVYRLMFDRDVRAADLEDQISDVRRLAYRFSKLTKVDDDGGTFRVSLFSDDQQDTIKAWRKALNKMNKAQQKAEDSDDAKVITDLADASEAFEEIHAEVLDMLEGIFSRQSALEWASRITTGNSMDFDSKGPETRFTDKRTLPPEADEIMMDFYDGNPLDLIQQYLVVAPRRAEYVRRAGRNSQKIENLLTRAGELGADAHDIREIRNSINMLTGRDRSTIHSQTSWAGGWMYTVATIFLLKRAFFSSWAEPIVAGLRTGNAFDGFRALSGQIGQFVGTATAKDRLEVARVIGLVTSTQHESILMNRFGGDLDPTRKQGKALANFFKFTMLTQLTNTQRVGMIKVADRVINLHLESAMKGKKWAREELADLGIGPSEFKEMKDWLDSKDGAPTADDLMGVDGNFYNNAAALYAQAVERFVNEVVQNPRRFSRPRAALDPRTRMIYGITGFIYSFHSNVLLPLFKRGIDKRGDSESLAKYAARSTFGSARNIVGAAPAMAALFGGHLLVTVLREALFNRETWEKKEDEDELAEWLMQRAFARTGLLGAWDIPYNLYTGVKYQRDLAGAYAGPHMSWWLGNLEKIIALKTRNSPNTNTAERQATEAALDMIGAVAQTMLVAAVPSGGSLTTIGMGASIFGFDALDPAAMVAEEIFPKEED